MEKRSASTIVLGGTALVVAVAVGVLVVKVRASAPPPDLSSHDIASAQARMTPSRIDTPSRPSGMIGAPAGLPARVANRAPDEEAAPPITSPDVSLEKLGKGGLAGAAGDDGEDGEGEDGPGGGSTKQVEANRLYDRGDYEGAAQLADEILKDDPDNARVLRIAASSACVMGDVEKAKGFHGRLAPRDQRKIARRCKRYGIEF